MKQPTARRNAGAVEARFLTVTNRSASARSVGGDVADLASIRTTLKTRRYLAAKPLAPGES